MSIDVLQEKIRKTKCPVMLELSAAPADLPEAILQAEPTEAGAYERVCRELLEALKGEIPAVRFSFASFALLGPEGLAVLTGVLKLAKRLGYYVVLDGPEILGVRSAQNAAQRLFGGDSPFPCDGVVLNAYLGSDGIAPFLPGCREGKKTVFAAIRTANRTAPELQDLLAGGRLVHIAAADIISRLGSDLRGKNGYSPVCAMSAANAPDSLKALRSKYPGLFLLVDGYNAVGANAKNCSYAFDKFGHGAIVCGGGGILRAWQDTPDTDYLEAAQAAVARMKRNLLRYVTIL